MRSHRNSKSTANLLSLLGWAVFVSFALALGPCTQGKLADCPAPSGGAEFPSPSPTTCPPITPEEEPATVARATNFLGPITAAGPVVPASLPGVTLQEINPDQSTLDPSDPDGASSGRTNGLASVAGDNQTFYTATEWGGLYRSTDGGLNWSFLKGHRPLVTWDVEVDPSNSSRVYATSFYDGRVTPLSGINVSIDAGTTWSRPGSLTAWGAIDCSTQRQDEPSAFGIGIRPDATNNVFVGTNCGVAISTNSGQTWSFVDPTPGDAPGDVWDVVVQAGGPSNMGIVDICGDDGHLRSTDGGSSWTSGAALPSGRCSISASPDESYVLFVVASNNSIYESDDAGATWTNLGNRSAQGRIPFVETNQRSDDASGNDVFDLWYGDVSLFRGTCTTPATPAQGGANRCGLPATWSGPYTRGAGAHDDAGAIVFDTQAANDACPKLFSSDGGVYYNTDTNATTCHAPRWEQPTTTPHAQWLFAMDGADQPGDTSEDLYYGTQDVGSFAATDAGAATPTWNNRDCCDVFDVVADASRVAYTLCCFGGRANRLFVRNPGMVGGGEIGNYPSGASLPGFRPIDIIARFGDKKYVLVDGAPGIYFTDDITASPIVWTQLGAATTPGGACGVEVGIDGVGTPTFYVQAGICNERSMANNGDQLWKFVGTGAGSWAQIDTNISPESQGIGIFAVDPKDPNWLYASNIRAVADGGPQMVFSSDGGLTWSNDGALDTRMTGGGVFRYRTERGPGNFAPRFLGYPQPTLVAFDPDDSDILVAGGRDSGVFLSLDGGASWAVVTDPFTSDTSGVPHLPRPWFAYFDHEPAGFVDVYLGTQGRGVWRLTLELPRIRVIKQVDAQPDGVFDDDPSGWTFDVEDDGEASQVTDGTGMLDFVLPPAHGTYEVKEVAQPAGDGGLWLVTASCAADADGAPVGTDLVDQLFGPGLPPVTLSDVDLEGLGDTVTCTFENQRMAGFVTGGGQIRTDSGRSRSLISYGGNVGIALDGSTHGQWQTNFHDVGNDNLDGMSFHSTAIDGILFGTVAGEPPDPPDAVFNTVGFDVTGQLDGRICSLHVQATDHGEPARGSNAGEDSDGIRFQLDCPDDAFDYDSSVGGGGEFSDDDIVGGLHYVDAGNLQIHPPEE